MLLLWFLIALKTSASNKGLVLDFNVKVLIGVKESIAYKNLVKTTWSASFTQVWFE